MYNIFKGIIIYTIYLQNIYLYTYIDVYIYIYILSNKKLHKRQFHLLCPKSVCT